MKRPLPFTASRWANIDPEIQARILVEYEIISSLVDELLEQGCLISINDGDGIALRKSTDRTKILESIMSVDEEHLIVYHQTGRLGSIFLVYGNDGWDVVNDYSTSLEPCIPQTLALIDKLGE